MLLETIKLPAVVLLLLMASGGWVESSFASAASLPSSITEIDEWFATIVARLTGRFTKISEQAEKLEAEAITNAESKYKMLVWRAERQEARQAQQALDVEAKTIKQAEDEYEKTLEKIENNGYEKERGKSEDAAARETVHVKLHADIERAEKINRAREKRAAEIETAIGAMAAAVEQARITRTRAREHARVDRSGSKFVLEISLVGDRYLAKLQEAGADWVHLAEAEHARRKALVDAESEVKAIQQNAVQDDIVRRTTRIGEEHEVMKKLGRLRDEHEHFQRRNRLADQQEREFIYKKR